MRYLHPSVALLLVALLAAAGYDSSAAGQTAAGQAAASKLEVPYTEFTLPNGLHVILHEDHSVPVVAVNVWYQVGSAREKPGRTGFAHLFEHIMFEGSAHVKEGEFDTMLEAVGGDNNGSTSNDRTNYWITCRRTRWRSRCSSNRIEWGTCSTRYRPSASTASATS